MIRLPFCCIKFTNVFFFHYYVTGKTGEQMEGLDRFQWVYGVYSVLIGGKIDSNREIPFKNNVPSLRGY